MGTRVVVFSFHFRFRLVLFCFFFLWREVTATSSTRPSPCFFRPDVDTETKNCHMKTTGARRRRTWGTIIMGTFLFLFFILATLQDHERLLSAHYSLLQTLYPLPCSTTPSIHFPLHFRSAGLCENELLTAHLKKVLDVFNHTTSPLIALNHGEKVTDREMLDFVMNST